MEKLHVDMLVWFSLNRRNPPAPTEPEAMDNNNSIWIPGNSIQLKDMLLKEHHWYINPRGKGKSKGI